MDNDKTKKPEEKKPAFTAVPDPINKWKKFKKVFTITVIAVAFFITAVVCIGIGMQLYKSNVIAVVCPPPEKSWISKAWDGLFAKEVIAAPIPTEPPPFYIRWFNSVSDKLVSSEPDIMEKFEAANELLNSEGGLEKGIEAFDNLMKKYATDEQLKEWETTLDDIFKSKPETIPFYTRWWNSITSSDEVNKDISSNGIPVPAQEETTFPIIKLNA
jgi:hypothetical protein